MTEPNSVPRRSRTRLLSRRCAFVGVLWLVSLAIAGQASVFLLEKRIPILRRLGLLETSGVLQTNLYSVRFQRVPIPIDGRYGAIAPLANGVLFASRSGRLWFVDSSRALRPLGLRVPINIAEFDSDPSSQATADKDRFAVKDLLVQYTNRSVRLLASHNQWNRDQQCYGLRVSMIELPIDSLLGAVAGGAWETLFDTRPCLAVEVNGEGRRVLTIGAGGRLEALSDRAILLTVGGWLNDSLPLANPEAYRDPARDYGKTLVIDLVSRSTRIFTQGHRNPQGLALGADARIWVTEHSLRGGDELNLLREGRDYGYPYVSLGTRYQSLDWPLSPVPGRHDGYEKPVYAWAPSIGPSQLLVVRGGAFSRWRGDLLVTSLAARTIFRLRLDGDHVMLAEPIPTIHRIRDIIETARGEVVLLAEDGFLVYLTPLTGEAGSADLGPLERGQLVAGRCQGCHSFERGGAHGIGPNLFGVVGRRVAASGDYAYSQALRSAGGHWTEDAIRRFVSNPSAFAPGTSMEFSVALAESELDDLILYLLSIR